MTKLDLALISQQGYGQLVPKEMDRHMVKFVVGQREMAVKAALANNDNSPFVTNRWDHSDVFYQTRTWLNQHGWDTSVYNDDVAGGSDRRKNFYDMIQGVCEDYYHVKRHQIGIYPADRAVMAFKGSEYSIGFDQLYKLMWTGTDVIAVEKSGTVTKMIPFTNRNAIAFIQSQGFVSEYGVALARLAAGHRQAAYYYLSSSGANNSKNKALVPKEFACNLGALTDFDSSGLEIWAKIPCSIRLGIDVNTIAEMNQANPGLSLKLEDMVEGTTPNTHWQGLTSLYSGNGKGTLYKDLANAGLSEAETFEMIYMYRNYLGGRIVDENGNSVSRLEYLKDHRIELNTILDAAGPQAFWNWLKWKILQVWPRRNYFPRARMGLGDYMYTPTMNKFLDWAADLSKPIIKDDLAHTQDDLIGYEGLIDDVDKKKEEIEERILNDTLLQDKRIQKLDKALEKIMKDGRFNK